MFCKSCKRELSRINKIILDKINPNDQEEMKSLNQWKSTDTIIDWFEEIKDKHLRKFLILGMKDFYPSITESLMKKALDFAETHTHALQKKIKLLLDIPENHCCFKKDKHG